MYLALPLTIATAMIEGQRDVPFCFFQNGTTFTNYQ